MGSTPAYIMPGVDMLPAEIKATYVRELSTWRRGVKEDESGDATVRVSLPDFFTRARALRPLCKASK